jgi:lincosamide nucleotidyltransferase A/C/D/E
MTATEVVNLYKDLEEQGIQVWVDGGWSIDALLEKQIRNHNDLDLAIDQKDFKKFIDFLTTKGYKEIRRDNEYNLVFGNNSGSEVDAHFFIKDDEGNIVDGITYPTESLTGSGVINGYPVRCIDPNHMVEFLAPYISKHPRKYIQAVSELCKKFNIPLPKEYIDYQPK